jgi:hypothetical protein
VGIFVPGMKCPLCGKLIEPSDEKAALSPFVRNLSDPLAIFSDAVFHRSCFENHPLRASALARAEELTRYIEAAHICFECGEQISADELFETRHLTDDESDPLHEFNYITLHRHHLEQWSRYSEFERLVTAFQNSSRYMAYDPILPGAPHRAPPARIGKIYSIR